MNVWQHIRLKKTQIVKVNFWHVRRKMAANFFRFDKDDSDFTKSDIARFASSIIGIIGSALIALGIFNMQETGTKNLGNKIKYSEISIDLHKSARTCKSNLKYASSDIIKNGRKNYTETLSQKLFACRSELLPFLSGLKAFEDREYGVNERKLLIEFDEKMQKVFDSINLLNEDKENISADELVLLNLDIASLVYGNKKDPSLNTIEIELLSKK